MNPGLGFMVCIVALLLGIIALAVLESSIGALRELVKKDRLAKKSNELLLQADLDPAMPEFISVRPPNSPK